MTIVSRDSWFLEPGILNPADGLITRVPLDFTGDIYGLEWAQEGHIPALAEIFRAHIWKIQRVK